MADIGLCPLLKLQLFDDDGTPLNGGKIYFFEPGTSTPKDTYTDQGGGTPNAHPVVLDARGEADVFLNGNYDVTVDRSDDTQVYTQDDVSMQPSTTTVLSEWWAKGDTPTYVSTTSFTVPGDETADYQVGRRVKCTVTAGTVYGKITAVAYTSLTTITVELNSGSLDSGLSVVDLGILSATNSSIPKIKIEVIDGTEADHVASIGQLQSGAPFYAAITGTDTYAIALAPVPAAYTNGMHIFGKITNANATTTPTLNVNGLGAKTIKRGNSAALLAGDLPANHQAIFRYDGTDIILLNPALHTHSDGDGGGGTLAPAILTLAGSAWPSFSVNKGGSDQTNVGTALEIITWSTELFDTNSDFASNRFTPTVAGKYLLTVTLNFSSPADQDGLQCAIYKNGVAVHQSTIRAAKAGSESVVVTCVVDANGSSDYFEVFGADANTADTVNGAITATFFCGCRIG